MLAHVTYIQTFIMADSEDEFMPIFVAASAAFEANNPKHLPTGRRAAGNIKHILLRRPTSCGHRLDARRPADATIFGTHITDAPRRPTHCICLGKIGRPTGSVSSRL